MAGMAFSQAGLGLCHAASHVLGGRFHVPHGRLNAILLPAVVSCNGQWVGPRYASLARQIGLGGSSDAIALRNLKNALIRLRNQLKLPATLAQAGVSVKQLQDQEKQIIAAALQDPCCQTNPVAVSEDMVRQVLREVAGRG